MMNMVSIILIAVPMAVAPGIGLSFFIYFKDKFEKEPFRLLRNCFLFGAVSIIPAIIIELLSGFAGMDENKGVLTTFFYAFCIVAVAEEVCKYVVLRFYVYKNAAFNEPFDGIVYAVMISMGFATVENILYAVTSGVGTTVLRMFTAVPLHAVCAIFMGYFIGKAKFSGRVPLNIAKGLFFAVLAHGLYDFFLFQKNVPALGILSFVTLGASVYLSFVAINKHQKNSPFNNRNSGNMINDSANAGAETN
ncbi:MAG TPA: PrsW family glutamic-type intramembrane protease [Bacteroidales bacterium]|nr:PrsW family glutamic-type intramembrane protease [Bacteroidales bacterium]